MCLDVHGQDLELGVEALLIKTGDSNRFIREDADRSLKAMVNSVTPSRALAALITHGVGYVQRCSLFAFTFA